MTPLRQVFLSTLHNLLLGPMALLRFSTALDIRLTASGASSGSLYSHSAPSITCRTKYPRTAKASARPELHYSLFRRPKLDAYPSTFSSRAVVFEEAVTAKTGVSFVTSNSRRLLSLEGRQGAKRNAATVVSKSVLEFRLSPACRPIRTPLPS